MQNNFSGYYRPSDNVLKEIWRKCIFVLDTNVLLGLYRYPKEAHDELIRTFRQISDRIWIPHQVALEYQENRLSVISEQLVKYDDVVKIVSETQLNLESKINELQLKRRHSVINPEGFLNRASQVFKDFQAELDKLKKEQPDISDDDLIRSDIDQLVEDKIGSPLTANELRKLYDEGKERYEQRRPPGYLDKGKTKQDDQFYFFDELVIKREFGDLIIWFQMIKDAANKKVEHIIFITDDDKEDWWWIYKGKTMGARPELVQEIKQKAGVKSFYMYNSARFLKYAREFLGANINQETINQVKEISELQKSIQSRASVGSYVFWQIEELMYKWLQSRYSDGYEIIRNEGFPDFTLIKENQKVAYEVKYTRSVFSSRLREFAYRGFYEVSQGRFDIFYFAFVIDHDTNSEIERLFRNMEVPEGVRVQIFEAFKDSNGNVVDLHLIKELSENK